MCLSLACSPLRDTVPILLLFSISLGAYTTTDELHFAHQINQLCKYSRPLIRCRQGAQPNAQVDPPMYASAEDFPRHVEPKSPSMHGSG